MADMTNPASKTPEKKGIGKREIGILFAVAVLIGGTALWFLRGRLEGLGAFKEGTRPAVDYGQWEGPDPIVGALQLIGIHVDALARPPFSYTLLYIQRKFSAQKDYPLSWNIPKTLPESISGVDPLTLKVVRRLYDPSATMTPGEIQAIPQGNPLKLMASALYCTLGQLPENFQQDARSFMSGGGLSTAAMAYQWLLENKCAEPWQLDLLYWEMVKGLEGITKDENTQLFSQAQAAAVLFYIGAGDKVAPAFIDKLRKTQHKDGGWPSVVGQQTDHTTIWAVWVLLEAKFPDVPDVPMVPQAGGSQGGQPEGTAAPSGNTTP